MDFAPPVGYEEPKAQPTRKRLDSYSTGVASSASLSIDEHKVAEDAGKKWTSFSGQGARLSGRPLGLASPLNNG